MIASNSGLLISAHEFENHFIEHQVPYSHALQCAFEGKSYLVGPLARLHLNYDALTSLTKEVLRATGLQLPFRRASMGIVARAAEVLHCIDHSLHIIDQYEKPPLAAVPFEVKAGMGSAVTEAPRGLLFHRFRVGEDGTIREAKIVPPTSQNQRRMEDDLREALPPLLHFPNEEVARLCEGIIRSYDPCISCATHFLRLDIHHLPDVRS